MEGRSFYRNRGANVCPQYLKGSCSDDNCSMSHTDPSRPKGVQFGGDGQSSQVLCRFFLSGNCKNGNSCTFKHEANDDDDGPDDNNNNNKINNHRSNKDDNEKDSWIGQSQNRSKKMCIHYAKGSCNKGDDCRFSHEKPDLEDDDDNNNNSGDNDTIAGGGGKDYDGDEERPQQKKQLCRNFQKGYCKFDNCKFSHEISEEAAPSGASNAREGQDYNQQARQLQRQLSTGEGRPKLVCRYFAQRGSCRNGDQCKFEHTSPSDPAAAVVAAVIGGGAGNSVKEEEQKILKTRKFRFSVLKIGKQIGLTNPKEIVSVGSCRLVAFFENGFMLLRMTSKKFKEKLLAKKGMNTSSQSKMEEEGFSGSQDVVEEQNGGLILEVLDKSTYPIEKVIADKVFLKARRWALVSFQNPILKTYGFLVFDLQVYRKQKLKKTACLAVQVAHASSINSAEFCLKNEVFEERLKGYQPSSEYGDDNNQEDEEEVPLSKWEREHLRLDRQQKWVMERITDLENEINSLLEEIYNVNQDASLSEEEKSVKNKPTQDSADRCESVKQKLQDLFDSLQTEQEACVQQGQADVEGEGDNGSQDNDGDSDDGDGYGGQEEQKRNGENDEEEFDSCDEEEELLQADDDEDDDEIEGEGDAGAKKIGLQDNFSFDNLIVESSFATSLSDLILLTSSNDGMVKVWHVEGGAVKQTDATAASAATTQKKDSNQPKEEAKMHSQDKRDAGSKSNLVADFAFKAELNEELSKHISNSILKNSVIASMLQLTTHAKLKKITYGGPQALQFSRILLLGGEKGLIYSIGLNFSLSKVSQIGSSQSKVQSFFVSASNQIFCVVDGYNSHEVHQIGHESSVLVNTADYKIDAFYSQILDEENVASVFYGNGNRLVQRKGTLARKPLTLSEEVRFKTLVLDRIKPDELPQEEANEEDAENNPAVSNANAQAVQQSAQASAAKDNEEKLVADLSRPISLQRNDFSEMLAHNDKVQNIVEININKEQKVLFAFVLNEAQQYSISQDAYLFNFDCQVASASYGNQRHQYRRNNSMRGAGGSQNPEQQQQGEKPDRSRERTHDQRGGDQQDDQQPQRRVRFDGISRHLDVNRNASRNDQTEDSRDNRRGNNGQEGRRNNQPRNPRGDHPAATGGDDGNAGGQNQNGGRRNNGRQPREYGQNEDRRNNSRGGPRSEQNQERRPFNNNGNENRDNYRNRQPRNNNNGDYQNNRGNSNYRQNQQRGGQNGRSRGGGGNNNSRNRSEGSSWNKDKIQQ